MSRFMVIRSRRASTCHARVDIEQTPENLHAYAIPEGINIRPGDRRAGAWCARRVGFRRTCALAAAQQCRRANWFGRTWARLTGLLALTELYEVGFEPRN